MELKIEIAVLPPDPESEDADKCREYGAEQAKERFEAQQQGHIPTVELVAADLHKLPTGVLGALQIREDHAEEADDHHDDDVDEPCVPDAVHAPTRLCHREAVIAEDIALLVVGNNLLFSWLIVVSAAVSEEAQGRALLGGFLICHGIPPCIYGSGRMA